MIITLQNKSTKLGQGAFGNVYEGVDEKGRSYAVKVNKDFKNQEAVNSLIQEDFYLRYLHRGFEQGDSHLVKRIAWAFLDHWEPALVLQKESQNLYNYCKLNDSFSTSQVRFITKQVAQALLFLKQAQVIHADVKPGNILVSSDGSCVKLADFGICFFQDEPYHPDFHVQTIWYRSPEVVLDLQPTYAIDVWSLAVVISEVYANRCAFTLPSSYSTDESVLLAFHQFRLQRQIPDHVLKKASKQGLDIYEESKNIHLGISDHLFSILQRASNKKKQTNLESHGEKELLFDLLKKMFVYEPDQRLSIESVLTHPFYGEAVSHTELTNKVFQFEFKHVLKAGDLYETSIMFNHADGKEYVIKRSLGKHGGRGLQEDRMLRYLLRAGGHEKIVNRLTISACQTNPLVIFEKEEMDLLQYLNKGPVSVEKTLEIAQKLLQILVFLEQEGVIHGSISLEHVLVSSDLQTVKLCSFRKAYFKDVQAPVNPLVDLVSVACVLFELYTNQSVSLFRLNLESLEEQISQAATKKQEDPSRLIFLLFSIIFPLKDSLKAEDLLSSFNLVEIQ